MSNILTINEMVREKMDQASDAVSAQFINTVRPIYGSSENGNPIHLGTCLLLEWNCQHYLITAAHIIDENEHSTLYVGVGSSLISVDGVFNATEKPNGDRDKDHYDFAWLKLSEASMSAYKNFEYIPSQNILSGNHKPGKNLHLGLGYPNSKNKQLNIVDHSLKPRYMNYSSTIVTATKLCDEWGISGKDHLFLKYDRKHAKDSEGNIVNTLSPCGTSGGALIDMGSFNKTEVCFPGHRFKGHLAGMLIEYSQKYNVLVAVRIHLILKTIVTTLS